MNKAICKFSVTIATAAIVDLEDRLRSNYVYTYVEDALPGEYPEKMLTRLLTDGKVGDTTSIVVVAKEEATVFVISVAEIQSELALTFRRVVYKKRQWSTLVTEMGRATKKNDLAVWLAKDHPANAVFINEAQKTKMFHQALGFTVKTSQTPNWLTVKTYRWVLGFLKFGKLNDRRFHLA